MSRSPALLLLRTLKLTLMLMLMLMLASTVQGNRLVYESFTRAEYGLGTMSGFAVGDVSLDGNADVVVASDPGLKFSIGSVWWIENRGDGEYGVENKARRVVGMANVGQVWLSDVNGDHAKDVLVATQRGAGPDTAFVVVLNSNVTGDPFPQPEEGEEEPAASYTISTSFSDVMGLATGTIDSGPTTDIVLTYKADGEEDMILQVLFNEYGNGTVYTQSTLWVYPGSGDLNTLDGVAVGDLDGDGLAEIVVTGCPIEESTVAQVFVFPQTSSQVFGPPIQLGGHPFDPLRQLYCVKSPVIVNLTNDSLSDIVVASNYRARIVVIPQTSALSFGTPTFIGSVNGAYKVIARDVENDGTFALFAIGGSGISVSWSAGVPDLSFPREWADMGDVVTALPRFLQVDDLDRDGVPDVVVAAPQDSTFRWFSGQLWDAQFSFVINATDGNLATGNLGQASTFSIALYDADGAPTEVAPSLHLLEAFMLFNTVAYPVTNLTALPPGHPDNHHPDGGAVLLMSAMPPLAGPGQVFISLGGMSLPLSPYLYTVKELCSPGKRTLNAISCTPCDPSTYSTEPGVDQCTPCPSFSTGPQGSSSPTNCSCLQYYWRAPGRDATEGCEPCPPGGVCPGNGVRPYASPGFYEVELGSGEFARCPRRSACAGANGCNTGYTGYLCASCQSGYYSNSASLCVKCPASGSVQIGSILALLGLALICVTTGLIWSLIRQQQLLSKSSLPSFTSAGDSCPSLVHQFRLQTVPVTLPLILVAAQLVSVISDIDFSWSNDATAVLRVFSYFNFDTSLVANECSLTTYHTKYLVSVLGTFSVCILCFIVIMAVRTFLSGRVDALSGLASLSPMAIFDFEVFALSPLVYIPIARVSFQPFDCVRLPGSGNQGYVLDIDPGVKCFDSKWWQIAPVAALVVLVFVLGFPIYVLVSLLRRREELYTPSVMVRCGTLYRKYRSAFFFSEAFSLARRLGIVVAAIFFNQLAQIGALLTIILLGAFLVVFYRPYFDPHHDACDVRLSIVLVAILLVGAGFYAERGSTSSSTETLFLVLLVGALLALVLVSVYSLYRDVYLILRARRFAYSPSQTRQARLARVLNQELDDIMADPDTAQLANDLLAVMGAERTRVGAGAVDFDGGGQSYDMDDLGGGGGGGGGGAPAGLDEDRLL